MRTTITRAADAEQLVAGPTLSTIHVPGHATDGRASVVTMSLDAGWSGPPPHVHGQVSHCWFVLDGAVELTVDEVTATYVHGDCLWVPAGVPHGFSTASTDGATVLQLDTGRALDGYLRDLAAAVPAGTRPDPTEVASIMAAHDTHPA